MSKVQEAVANYHGGYNCAQAVIAAYCEEFGLDKEAALRLSCGFGGGMGRQGETCGAVSGAYMLIGMCHGQQNPQAKDKTYAMVREFARQFKERQQATNCHELLKNIGQDAKKDRCARLVQDAAEIVEGLLKL